MSKRTISNCSSCPLRDRKRVWGQGPETAELVLIGEAPGRDEEEKEKPFVGPAGRILNVGLANTHILRHNCYITNLIPCRPPDNNLYSDEGKEALECCREGFEEELGRLKPKCIVLLGAKPSKFLLNLDDGITNSRGYVYNYRGIPVISTYHPSYIMRMQYDKRGATVNLTAVWQADLAKALEISRNGWVFPKENFLFRPDLRDIERFVSDDVLYAVDIETTSLNPFYGNIVCLGLAKDAENALVIPFLTQYGVRYWTERDEIEVRKILNRFFMRRRLLLQNAIFDLRYLRYHNFLINLSNIIEDTLLLHHAIDPELPHGLSFIGSVYGKTRYWKDVLLKRKGSILDLPNKELWTYNARDCVVLHQCRDEMLKDLKEGRTEHIYYESCGLIRPVILMTESGVKLSRSRLESWVKKRKTEAKIVATRLKGIDKTPEGFNYDSDDDLRMLLFGIVPQKFIKATNELKKREEKIKELTEADKLPQVTRMKGTKIYKELLRKVSLMNGIKPMIWINYNGRKTDTGKLAVNAEALLSYRIKLQNRLEQIGRFVHQDNYTDERRLIDRILRWLENYSELTKLNKLVTTYGDLPTDPDGRIRPSWLIHGTSTGRLACANPNLMNLPKKDEDFRKCLIAYDDHMLISADYSNLEVRVLAYEINDRKLIYALEHGLNVHDNNTKILFQIDEKNPNWTLARRAAKIFFFGGLAYGGGDQGIYQEVVLECTSLNLTFSQFKTAKSRWLDAHPDYVRWERKISDSIIKTREVRNFHGRVRRLYGDARSIVKEGKNFPIQSGAAEIINDAWKRIVDLGINVIMQIHDQLVAECRVSEVDKAIRIMKEQMEKPVKFYDQEVSFPVDISIGPSLGELEDVKCL